MSSSVAQSSYVSRGSKSRSPVLNKVRLPYENDLHFKLSRISAVKRNPKMMNSTHNNASPSGGGAQSDVARGQTCNDQENKNRPGCLEAQKNPAMQIVQSQIPIQKVGTNNLSLNKQCQLLRLRFQTEKQNNLQKNHRKIQHEQSQTDTKQEQSSSKLTNTLRNQTSKLHGQRFSRNKLIIHKREVINNNQNKRVDTTYDHSDIQQNMLNESSKQFRENKTQQQFGAERAAQCPQPNPENFSASASGTSSSPSHRSRDRVCGLINESENGGQCGMGSRAHGGILDREGTGDAQKAQQKDNLQKNEPQSNPTQIQRIPLKKTQKQSQMEFPNSVQEKSNSALRSMCQLIANTQDDNFNNQKLFERINRQTLPNRAFKPKNLAATDNLNSDQKKSKNPLSFGNLNQLHTVTNGCPNDQNTLYSGGQITYAPHLTASAQPPINDLDEVMASVEAARMQNQELQVGYEGSWDADDHDYNYNASPELLNPAQQSQLQFDEQTNNVNHNDGRLRLGLNIDEEDDDDTTPPAEGSSSNSLSHSFKEESKQEFEIENVSNNKPPEYDQNAISIQMQKVPINKAHQNNQIFKEPDYFNKFGSLHQQQFLRSEEDNRQQQLVSNSQDSSQNDVLASPMGHQKYQQQFENIVQKKNQTNRINQISAQGAQSMQHDMQNSMRASSEFKSDFSKNRRTNLKLQIVQNVIGNHEDQIMTGPTTSNNTDRNKYGSSIFTKQSSSEYQILNNTMSKNKKNSPNQTNMQEFLNHNLEETSNENLTALKVKHHRLYQSHAIIHDVNNSDEEKSSTEVRNNQNQMAYQCLTYNKNKKKTRYNPARDPDFDLDAPEYINPDRRNSIFSASELQRFDQQMLQREKYFKEESQSPEILDETQNGLDLDTKLRQSNQNSTSLFNSTKKHLQLSKRFIKKAQRHSTSSPKLQHHPTTFFKRKHNQSVNIVPRCKLKINKKVGNYVIRRSQVGGGKLFRESQLNNTDSFVIVPQIERNDPDQILVHRTKSEQFQSPRQATNQRKRCLNYLVQNTHLSEIQDNSQDDEEQNQELTATSEKRNFEAERQVQDSRRKIRQNSSINRIEKKKKLEIAVDEDAQPQQQIDLKSIFVEEIPSRDQKPFKSQFDPKALYLDNTQDGESQQVPSSKNQKSAKNMLNKTISCSSSSLYSENDCLSRVEQTRISSILMEQQDKYQKHCQKRRQSIRRKEMNDDFVVIVNSLKENPIKCFKYNHCLDFDLQKHISFQSYIQLRGSLNDLELVITNKIPVQKELKYAINTEPEATLFQRRENHIKKSQKLIIKNLEDNFKFQFKQHVQNCPSQHHQFKFEQTSMIGSVNKPNQTIPSHHSMLSSSDHSKHLHQSNQTVKARYISNLAKSRMQQLEEEELAHQILSTELDEEIDEITFKERQSSGSCKVSDIKNIIFGGVSSRFWMLRKHINMLSEEQLLQLPFYSWQCITLQLKHRDVDLVIRDQNNMELFLKFLIRAMKTVDGRKDSAKPILETLNKQEITRFQFKVNNGLITDKDKQKIIRQNENKIYQKILMKYKIMTIRSKISYIAAVKLMTIQELITRQIQQTYHILLHKGLVKVTNIERKIDEEIYQKTVSTEIGVFKKILLKNIDKYQLQTQARARIEEQMKNKPKSLRIKIKVKGVVTNKKINEEENRLKEQRITKLIQKENCQNLFKDLGNSSGVDTMPYQQFINYKFEKKTREIILNKIRLLQAMNIISGEIFVKSIINKIELLKELLLLDIQFGIAVHLCDELNMNQLPLSFRYYDPILRIILKKLNPLRQTYYQNQKNLSNMLHFNTNSIKLLQCFGFDTGQDGTVSSLAIKQKQINEVKRKEINFKFSKHVMQLQRSNYLQIDDNIEYFKEEMHSDFKHRDPELYQTISNTGLIKEMESSKYKQYLDIKFLDHREVNKNRQNFLILKQNFLLRQHQLIGYGEKTQLMGRIENWIDSYIDDFYEKYSRTHTTHHIANKLSDGIIDYFKQSGQIDPTKSHSHDGKRQTKKQLKPQIQLRSSKTPQQKHHDQIRQALSRASEHGPELCKRYFKDILMKHAEKILLDQRMLRRSKHISKVRKKCAPEITIEDKEKFVDWSIEQDIKWFLTSKQKKYQDKYQLCLKSPRKNKLKQKKTNQDQKNIQGVFSFKMSKGHKQNSHHDQQIHHDQGNHEIHK